MEILPLFFLNRKETTALVTEKAILWDTTYGKIQCNLKSIMNNHKISMYKLERLTGLKHEVIRKYYYNNVYRYDADVLAKLCYVLNCEPSDIIKYIPNNK